MFQTILISDIVPGLLWPLGQNLGIYLGKH